MKKSLPEGLRRYIIIIICFFPAVLLIRLAEFVSLNFMHSALSNTWWLELSGLIQDTQVFFTFTLLLFIPFMLIYLLHWKTAVVLAITLFSTFTLLSLSLVRYYTVTLVPLDQVLFFYTPHELISIVLSSTRFEFSIMIVFLIILSVPFILYYFLRKTRPDTVLLSVFPAVMIISPFTTAWTIPQKENYQNDFEYFARFNKVEYVFLKWNEYRKAKISLNNHDHSFASIVKRYHYENREFSYIDPDYPMLRVDNTPDVLGQYFNFNRDKPNLVFLLVESLGSSYCGDNPYYGSFTPFLDSLIGQSLYWKNFLSTAERTFNILPAVFGSLPYSNEAFQYYTAPYHFSLIRYLKENGYYTSFFYGGDPNFGGYYRFLVNEKTDYILQYFGQGYNDEQLQKKLTEWGYFDHDVFRRSFEVIDSVNREPRLDIYLTLTSHAPFVTPDPKRYSALFEEFLKKSNRPANIKRMISLDRDVFKAILYMDESLREFFDAYKKRKDFNNTIFIITGDHAMQELNYSYLNLIEKYHVPLIIYSPMLKKAKSFKSVSSHLDITPSVLAMMRNQGFVKTLPVCHWMGRGIDITESFRNTHSMSFVFNNRIQSEYLHGEYFISSGRLYRLLPDLKVYPVSNVPIMEKMEAELNDYLYLTNDIFKRKSFIPVSVMLSGNYQEEPYTAESPCEISQLNTKNEFIRLVKGHQITDDFQYLSVEMSVSLKNLSRDTLNDPVMVVSVQDQNYKDCLWEQFPLKTISRSGDLRRVKTHAYVDFSKVPDLKSKNLKIYLLNANQVSLYLDDLKMELSKYRPNR